MDNATPEEKAETAAEELAAEGKKVTARNVRARAGVAMQVAHAAAQAHNKMTKGDQNVPDVPELVQRRLESVWREAYGAARADFSASRAGWEKAVTLAEEQAAELALLVEEMEGETEVLAATSREEAERAADQLAAAQALIVLERSRADKAEGALTAVTAERDRLVADLRSLAESTTERVADEA